MAAVGCLAVLLACSLTGVGAAAAGAKTPRAPRLKKPGPPLEVTVVPGPGGGTVSWQPPVSDGGSPITGYVVKVRTQGCTTTGDLSCTVTGLVDGHKYRAVVRAENAVGIGKHARRVLFVADQGPDCATPGPGANLQYCDLNSADLDGADLAGANLVGARLGYAQFEDADLSDADFSGDNLSYVHLDGANLDGADLSDTYLYSSWFTNAEMVGTNLTGAEFYLDDLDGATVTDASAVAVWASTVCPDGTNSDNDGYSCVNNLS